MMTNKVSVYSSMPRTVFRGVRDESTRQIPMPTIIKPIHLPLFFSVAPWGEEDKARFVNANAMNLLYGREVFDVDTPFFTHQSQFMRTNFEAGASAMFLRLVPEDAKQASIRFGIEIVADEIPEYERDIDGNIKRDPSGAMIETGNMVNGYRVRMVKSEIPVIANIDDYGRGAIDAGTLVSNTTNNNSDVYPLIDAKARFRGAKGNNLGIRLITPNVFSVDPADANTNERVGSYIYRLQMVERQDAISTGIIKPTIDGDPSLPFSFNRGAKDKNTQITYDLERILIPSYEDRDYVRFEGWGALEKFHLYRKNLKDVLELLADAEEAATGERPDPDHINFMTGSDVNGIPYHGFVIEGMDNLEDHVVIPGYNTTHYMSGGSDGTIDEDIYNQMADDFISNVQNGPIPLHDIAAYPFNSVWDSGFPLDTKLKLVNFHNMRPDVAVMTCTQDVSEPLNSHQADSSIGVRLKTEFRMQQESEEFGTSAYRFFLQKNAGYLINSDHDGIVPFLEHTLYLIARYMGGTEGRFNTEYSFGRGSQNVVNKYRDHNAYSLKDNVRNNDWSNGLTYAESFDIDEIFVPAYQSMYEDNTSVLQGMINMLIVCNLQRVGHEVWRRWTGETQMSDGAFMEALSTEYSERLNGIYDGRADIEPQVYKTKLDEIQGFAWHVDFDVRMENMRTVQHLSIIVNRRRGE